MTGLHAGACFVPASWFQALKLQILEWVPVSKDVAHAAIGLGVLLAVVVCFRTARPRWFFILPTVLVVLVGEVFDLREHAALSTSLLLASVHDLVVTVLPALTVLGALRLIRERRSPSFFRYRG